jgi:xylanolytic transcriptional activator XlnR
MAGAYQLPSASTSSSPSFLIDPVEDLAAGSDQILPEDAEDVAGNDSIHPCTAYTDGTFDQAASHGSHFLRWRRPSLSVTAHCRYRVLDPLLPYLGEILSVSMACDLFDIYLIDPGNSPFHHAPPYVLTRIFRRKPLLHPTDPRPMSAALLATILWCCAQAAEPPSLLVPGARSRTTKALYDLAVALISERYVGQWRRSDSHAPRSDSQAMSEFGASGGSTSAEESQSAYRTEVREHLGGVDDVLAYLLLCIAVSGGEFKADCQEWWHRAVQATITLGLHREDEACLLGVDCRKPMCSCRVPFGKPSLAFLEAREERRRVFWLLYCLDRHLALSHNRILQMPDSYVEVHGRVLPPPSPLPGTETLTC